MIWISVSSNRGSLGESRLAKKKPQGVVLDEEFTKRVQGTPQVHPHTSVLLLRSVLPQTRILGLHPEPELKFSRRKAPRQPTENLGFLHEGMEHFSSSPGVLKQEGSAEAGNSCWLSLQHPSRVDSFLKGVLLPEQSSKTRGGEKSY